MYPSYTLSSTANKRFTGQTTKNERVLFILTARIDGIAKSMYLKPKTRTIALISEASSLIFPFSS